MPDTKTVIVAPAVEPRGDTESGWDYRIRQRDAWDSIPAFAAFIEEVAEQVVEAVQAFSNEGNALPGFTPAGESFKTEKAYVYDAAADKWTEQLVRKLVKRDARSKVSYGEVAAHLTNAIKARAS
jgi:hypothetical protein